MRKLLVLLVLIVIFSSGCTTEKTKYVKGGSSQEYITLSSDGTAFYHSGSVENDKGTWQENEGVNGDTEITVFLADGSSLVFRKHKNTLMLKTYGGYVSYYKY